MADRVLITGARSAAALDLARDFRAAGWEPHLADCSPSRIARWSTACAGYHHYPSPVRDGPGFRARITALVGELAPKLIVPVCEEVFHLAAPALARTLGGRLFAPPLDLLRRLHDKLSFVEACAAWNLPVPESHGIDNTAALQRFVGDSDAWVFKPRFSRFGEAALIGPSPEELGRVSVDRAWLAQRRMHGFEASFYAVARRGRVTAFAAYRSDWRMRGGASYAFVPLLPSQTDQLRGLATALAGSAQMTGQFSCDVIFDAQDKAWLIECNPRATSGVHLLAGEGALARAMTDDTTTTAPQHAAPSHLAPAMLFFGLPAAIGSGRLGAWRRTMSEGQNVLGRPGDHMPLLGALIDSIGFSLSGLRHGITTSAATTRDIEWNGEALP